MTEYDYSPEAYERYLAKQSSIVQWLNDAYLDEKAQSLPDGSKSAVDDFSCTPAAEAQDAAPMAPTGRRRRKHLQDRGEAVWSPHLESALLEALEVYNSIDLRSTGSLSQFPFRNRFISDYIYEVTGKRRTRKQVGSRLQQLRDICKDDRILQLISKQSRSLITSHFCSRIPEVGGSHLVHGSKQGNTPAARISDLEGLSPPMHMNQQEFCSISGDHHYDKSDDIEYSSNNGPEKGIAEERDKPPDGLSRIMHELRRLGSGWASFSHPSPPNDEPRRDPNSSGTFINNINVYNCNVNSHNNTSHVDSSHDNTYHTLSGSGTFNNNSGPGTLHSHVQNAGGTHATMHYSKTMGYYYSWIPSYIWNGWMWILQWLPCCWPWFL